MRRGLALSFLLIIILGVFGVGFYLGESQIPAVAPAGVINEDLGKPANLDFSLFWEAWTKLEKKYVDSSKIDYKQMLYGAISGMVDSLGDDYTLFFPPEESKIFKEDVSGEFQGVGMEIGMRDNGLTIVSPMEGTPAEKAGLRAGDKILKIDDQDTSGLSVDEAVKLIRGQEGTEVLLKISRADWAEAKDFKIIRDVIEIPSLRWEIKKSADGNSDIAYIKLYQFSESARYSFQKAVFEILNSSAKKIVLDLRNNPGGYLEVAQSIAGWFLEKDQVVTIEEFGGKQENEVYRTTGSSSFLSYPTVVLINQGSASGSEILAGALRDDRGILLIGENSFGKGSVQELEDLKEGSLKITVARWLTPKGTLINGEGLTPDIEVKMTEEDYKEGEDPQLDKAIEILKDMP